jgi:NAD(P)-dependent dehydrogenase (short-subunit alcohol dehydrogenase family)
MKLKDKVAIVTGGAQGIGQGIACCLAEEGADVVIADINMENANKVAGEVRALGRKALVVEADVTRKDKVEHVVRSTLNEFGKIDILVNNVGGVRIAPSDAGRPVSGKGIYITDLDDEDWDAAYELNLKSQVYMCKAVVPHMKAQQSGKIINISSVAAKLGDSVRMPYSALKGSVISFTRSLARQVARDNINVNCICPGLIYTPSWQLGAEILWKVIPAYRELKGPKDVFLRYVERLTPMGREQSPEDIGRLAAFLASEDARNITGQTINVDGGQVMD